MKLELQPYLDAVEAELRQALPEGEPATAPLDRMMQYHMGWLDPDLKPSDAPRGKRLRPLMCLLACEATGGTWHQALPAACAIELIHNFTLLHDDIEDRSAMRRHRATVWSLWGIAQGINTGDAMWAAARLELSRLAEQGHAAEVVLRVARLLDETCLELCRGQYLDIAFEKAATVAVPQYERMIAGKTAALLAASLASGAILGGASEPAIAAYRAFGHELGFTFQITDDILGIWGDPTSTGKSAASDILTKKKTLPILYALQWEREHGLSDLAHTYTQVTLSPSDVPAVLSLLERAGALLYARRRAEEHLKHTLTHLQCTQITHPAQDALRELALSLVCRSA